MRQNGIAYLLTFYAFAAALVVLNLLLDPYRIVLGKYIPACGPVWAMSCKRSVNEP